MLRNTFTASRSDTMAQLSTDGASAQVELRTSREIEIDRLESKLTLAGDNWRAAERLQAQIDRLRQSSG